eukprot:jgi/Astpho2/8570/Aster-05056
MASGQAFATLGRLHGSRLQLQVPADAFPMLEAEPALAAHVSRAALPCFRSRNASSSWADQVSSLSGLTKLTLPNLVSMQGAGMLAEAGMLDALQQLSMLRSLCCLGDDMQTLLAHSVPLSWPLLTKLQLGLSARNLVDGRSAPDLSLVEQQCPQLQALAVHKATWLCLTALTSLTCPYWEPRDTDSFQCSQLVHLHTYCHSQAVTPGPYCTPQGLYLKTPDLQCLPRREFQRWLWQVGILQRAFLNSTLEMDEIIAALLEAPGNMTWSQPAAWTGTATGISKQVPAAKPSSFACVLKSLFTRKEDARSQVYVRAQSSSPRVAIDVPQPNPTSRPAAAPVLDRLPTSAPGSGVHRPTEQISRSLFVDTPVGGILAQAPTSPDTQAGAPAVLSHETSDAA